MQRLLNPIYCRRSDCRIRGCIYFSKTINAGLSSHGHYRDREKGGCTIFSKTINPRLGSVAPLTRRKTHQTFRKKKKTPFRKFPSRQSCEFFIPTNRLTRFALAAIISGIVIVVAHSAFTSAQVPLPAFPGRGGFWRQRSGRARRQRLYRDQSERQRPGLFPRRGEPAQPLRGVRSRRRHPHRQPHPGGANLTIAGQTAPGEGITIYGNGLSFSNANNTVTRYLRVRMGVVGDSGADAVTIAQGDNMIFDHVSVSWGRDETSRSAARPATSPCRTRSSLRGSFRIPPAD